MTPAEVKRILRKNRKAGRRPWSLYQIAQMRGCSRSLVTMTMQRPAHSRPMWTWIENTLRQS